jgi:tetratricopeptide (TPR) repeat protein
MGRHDWYRKSTWSKDDQADFSTRLARSRSGRSQYLLIQALHLRSAGLVEPAIELVEQYFREFPVSDGFHYVGALLQKAQCLEALGRIDEAEAAYLATLAEQRTILNYVTTVYTDFPWFAVKYGRRHLYSDALASLDAAGPHLMFPALRYQSSAVRALIAAENGDFISARRHAGEALQAAAARHSGFRYHPDVGLCRDPDPLVHERILQLANMALQPMRDAGTLS